MFIVLVMGDDDDEDDEDENDDNDYEYEYDYDDEIMGKNVLGEKVSQSKSIPIQW